MKRVIYRGWCILEVLIILYVIIVTSLILCQNKYGHTELFGYTFKNVQKSDLGYIKNVKVGDLVVIKNSHKIQQNDIVYYYFVSNEAYTVANDTVIKVEKNNNDTLYTIHTATKDLVVADSRIIGKKASAYPFFGGFLEKIASRTGFLLFVLLPIMIVFIYQVYEFFFTVRKQVEGKDNTLDSSLVNTDTDNDLDTNDSLSVEEKDDKKIDSEVIKEDSIETSEEFENKPEIEEDKSDVEEKDDKEIDSEEIKEDSIETSEEFENKSEIEDNKSDVEENKSEIEDNKSEIEEDKSDVEENKSEIEDNKSDVEEDKFRFVAEDKSDDEIEIL